MPTDEPTASLEAQIELWRTYLRRRQAVHSVDVAELEDHLREQIARLTAAGLASDEAFLVAVKRMGNLDALSREFAREHSDRLWKQLVIAGPDGAEGRPAARLDAIVAISLAVVAAGLIKAPALFGFGFDTHNEFYARNIGLFALPLLTGYFAWKRKLSLPAVFVLAACVVAAVIFANAYPFAEYSQTEALTALHLPIALWAIVGVAYAASRWRDAAGRMDFVRFSGELFIYYVLIALGGVVLIGFTAMIFQAAGLNIERFIESWIAPCGAMGAVLVAAWLVEAKQSVIENMAPVLARLFTPLFTIAVLAFLGVMLFRGRELDFDRNLLISFDLLLVVVLGLTLYSISARNPSAPPGASDVLQVVLVASALVADAVALGSIATRIGEYGFTANRVAALGENLILLVNLAWSAVIYIRFIAKKAEFRSIERWQTAYLPVFALWAAIVVIAFPPIFGFL